MFNLKQKSSEETDLRLKTKTNSNFISTVFHRSLCFCKPGRWENSPWSKKNIFCAINKNMFFHVSSHVPTCNKACDWSISWLSVRMDQSQASFLLSFPRVWWELNKSHWKREIFIGWWWKQIYSTAEIQFSILILVLDLGQDKDLSGAWQ